MDTQNITWNSDETVKQVGTPFEISVLLPTSIDLKAQLEKASHDSAYWIQDAQREPQNSSESQWKIKIVYFKSGPQPLPLSAEKIQIKSVATYIEENPRSNELKNSLLPSPPPSDLPVPHLFIGAALLLACAALAAILWGAFRWWRHRWKMKKELKRFEYKNVTREYRQKILSSKKSGDDVRSSAFLASELLRGYSAHLIQFGFLDLTTDEMRHRLQQWRRKAPESLDVERYLRFHETLDLMKYAPEPQTPPSEDFFQQGLEFIDAWHALEQRNV